MSDGHLYLDDRGVTFAAETRHAWHDEAHGSVLVLAPSTLQLVEIPLRGRHTRPHAQTTSGDHATGKPAAIVRSKSAPALSLEADAVGEKCEELGDALQVSEVDVLYDFSSPLSSGGRALDDTPIQLMRLSLDREFLAIQKSDVEVQVLRVSTGESYWVVCKPKAGNRILVDGVFWNTHASSPLSSQDLFLVTRHGIEQYRVSPKRRSCSLHRSIGVYVHTFWYAASHSMLIVSTGSRANEIVPFSMQGPSVEKLPRLVFSSAVRQRDLYLASLYGELYAVYGDSKTTRLLLYRVARDKVSCVRSLHLMLPADSRVEFSVLDNLLVCHSLEFSVSLFFDVRCDANVHDPFSHPLPVSLGAPASRQQSSSSQRKPPAVVRSASVLGPRGGRDNALATVGTNLAHALLDSPAASEKKLPPSQKQHASLQLDHHDQATVDENGRVISAWRFIAPDLIQRSISIQDPLARSTPHHHSSASDRIEVRRFQINLEQVCRSCAQHPEILPFLLRRGDQQHSKRLALGIVRERLEEQILSPSAASALLLPVQTVSSQDLRRRYGTGTSTSDESANDTSSDDELGWSHSARAVVPVSIQKRFFGSDGVAPAMRTARNANGLSLVLQSDFWHYVWEPLLRRPSAVSRNVIPSYLLEFIRLLRQSQVPVETLTYVALAKAYLEAGKTSELCQTLQYHVVSDSIELADLLLASSKQDRALRQLALDMYTRIGAVATVVQVLLDDNEINHAIVVAWQNKKVGSFDASHIPASAFFDACVRSFSTLRDTETLAIQQRLQTLLLFLRVWDRDCLEGSPSRLAQSATEQFPNTLLPTASCVRWRQAFGFSARGETILTNQAAAE